MVYSLVYTGTANLHSDLRCTFALMLSAPGLDSETSYVRIMHLTQVATILSMRTGIVLAIGALILIYLLVMEAIDMASRVEYIENHFPQLLKWAERRPWHRVLLLVGIGLLIGNIWDMENHIMPEMAPPIYTFPTPPAPAIREMTDQIADLKKQLSEKSRSKDTALTPSSQSAPSSSITPGSRHLTQVQSVRLGRAFTFVPTVVKIDVETVTGQAEASQYAAEINSVLNKARNTKLDVVVGLSWEKIPQGICVCMHSKENQLVYWAARGIAQEMLLTGIPVILNEDKSFPENTVRILVGVQAID